jgi:hypothetical protein
MLLPLGSLVPAFLVSTRAGQMLFSCPCEEVIYRVPIIFDINVVFGVRWLVHLSAILSISTENWPRRDTPKRFPVENPTTGEVVTTLQAGDAETTVKAIKAAKGIRPRLAMEEPGRARNRTPEVC